MGAIVTRRLAQWEKSREADRELVRCLRQIVRLQMAEMEAKLIAATARPTASACVIMNAAAPRATAMDAA